MKNTTKNNIDKFEALCDYIERLSSDNERAIEEAETELQDGFDPDMQRLLCEELAIGDTITLLKRKINELNA